MMSILDFVCKVINKNCKYKDKSKIFGLIVVNRTVNILLLSHFLNRVAKLR